MSARRHWLEVVGPPPTSAAFDRLTAAVEREGYEFVYAASEPIASLCAPRSMEPAPMGQPDRPPTS